MHALKARVVNGRLVLDEPTELPEGTELYLIPLDDADELDDEERERLHATLDESLEDMRAGRTHNLHEVLAELRSQK